LRTQFLALLTSRIVSAGAQAAIFILLSRAVPLEVFGWVGIVGSVVGFALLVGDLGVTAGLSRARAQSDQSFVAGALRLNDVITLFLVLPAATWACLTINSPIAPLAVFAVSLAIERNAETQLSVFYADGKKLLPAASVVGRRLVAVGLFVALLIAQLDPLWSFSVAQLAGAVFSQITQRLALRETRSTSPSTSFNEIFKTVWPFWMSSVLNQVKLLDVTIVGLLASSATAGLYSAAQRLVTPLMLIPAAVSQVVLPHSSRTGADHRSTARKVSAMFVASYVVIVPAALISPAIVAIIYPPSYAEAAAVLSWSLLALPPLALAGPLAAILQGKGEEKFVAFNGIVFAVVGLLLMGLGGWLSGGVGVAIAVLMTAILRVPILLLRIQRP